MKVLILGGTGMLGHMLCHKWAGRFELGVTIRRSRSAYPAHSSLAPSHLFEQVTAENWTSLMGPTASFQPEVVVNCIGIIKQSPLARDPATSIAINALFPHQLAQLCQLGGIRLIHISTDCVFSGKKGNYTEADESDATDLYGRTKYLGEVDYPGCLTIRTSMIGRELAGSYGLIEWFLSQQGKTVKGFTNAIFSGFTTETLADIIAMIILQYPDLHGVWQIASDPINKYDLLSLVNQIYHLDTQISPDDTFACDRSLDTARFQQATGFIPPTWPDMIRRMHEINIPYADLRRQNVNG
ncbi:MAG: SDR family oxidoreductase [Chloroflexi bacterium]|nr:SDR family oxidoreductase [Chloroflexota bacterium]